MKQSTLEAFKRAYNQLQDLVEELYAAAQIALDNDDFSDASLLQSRADKIYKEGENLEIFMEELDE